ncbi:ADP-ribosylglycohydrolase family protein, partial [Streptomyces sp. SID5998]|nr:ADP-ribosylglycohydrolase family protein [Streptomyces sp. SID5998]
GALAGATRGVAAVPEEWAAAIGPARGSCLPSMAGRHVLDVADLLLTAAETERRAAGEPRVEVVRPVADARADVARPGPGGVRCDAPADYVLTADAADEGEAGA